MPPRPAPAHRAEGPRSRWALAIVGALLLLGSLLAVPRGWIEAFFRPLGELDEGRPATSGPLLHILPPPTIEIVAVERPLERPEPAPVPWPRLDWWEAAWGERLRTAPLQLAAAGTAASLPALLAAPSLGELLARPDTSLGRILARLQAGDRREFERVRGLLSAAVHERRWQSILDQAARVHGEFQEAVEATPLPPPPR